MKKGTRHVRVTSRELSKSAGVSLSTIHYYTTLGLLHSYQRSGNKYLYRLAEAKARLKKIFRFRREGYSLVLIRRLLDEGSSGTFPRA